MIFHTEDRVWNIALVEVKPGIDRAKAAEELVRLGENVGDPFSAHKILRALPKSIKVKSSHLEEFKELFETQEYFHHQRYLVGPHLPPQGREVWVTMRDPDASPEVFFAMVTGLISQPPWDKVLQEAQIVLKSGVVITLDKEPLK
jgi:hypothetical protein